MQECWKEQFLVKRILLQPGISVTNIRSVIAGEYAGGCFGVEDVAGVANISAGNETSLLDKLLKLGRTDVLDAFRSYVYYGNVSGSEDAGLSVNANVAKKNRTEQSSHIQWNSWWFWWFF